MCTGLERLREVRERVRRQQSVFVAFAHGQIRGHPVQIDCRFDSARYIMRILRKQPGDEAR